MLSGDIPVYDSTHLPTSCAPPITPPASALTDSSPSSVGRGGGGGHRACEIRRRREREGGEGSGSVARSPAWSLAPLCWCLVARQLFVAYAVMSCGGEARLAGCRMVVWSRGCAGKERGRRRRRRRRRRQDAGGGGRVREAWVFVFPGLEGRLGHAAPAPVFVPCGGVGRCVGMVGRVRRDRWPATRGLPCRTVGFGRLEARKEPRTRWVPRLRRDARRPMAGTQGMKISRRSAEPIPGAVQSLWSTRRWRINFFPDDAATPHFLSMLHMTGDLET
jgi:hypothetical protein